MGPASFAEKIPAWAAVVLVGLLTFVGAAALGLGSQLREPKAHDEFSYLLAADTFAQGRLTNEPHLMWEHFESYHINQQPSYASKYPPAQGLFLAVGQVITGYPIFGVWLGSAAMCAAICWMLLVWFPTRWAVLGGVLAAAHYGIAGHWAQTYWGGAVAATGGALLIGALPRIADRSRIGDSILMGVGVAILANSRPYEGLVVSLVTGVALCVLVKRRSLHTPAGDALRRFIPAALVLAAAFASMSYYNYRVTGDPLKLPYTVNAETYQRVPHFYFQPDLETLPEYRHQEMREVYEGWAYKKPPGPRAWLRRLQKRAARHWEFYLGWLWTLPALALPWVLRDRWMRFCFGVCVLALLSHSVTTYGAWPHYLAPITGAVVALLVASLSQLAKLRWRAWSLGGFFVAIFVFLSMLGTWRGVQSHAEPDDQWNRLRAAYLDDMLETDTNHLVIVRYDPSHIFHREWVYNRADIDAARVVWARSMGPERDRVLIEHFSDRTAWLYEVGGSKVSATPHPLVTAQKGR